MSVPPFQEITLPLLSIARDRAVHSLADVREQLANGFQLTEIERNELLPSGRQTRFANRVAWAKVYLEQAALLSSPKRGQLVITPRGLSVLDNPPDRITIRFLEQFPEFATFRARRQSPVTAVPPDTEEAETPEELLEAGYQRSRAGLAADLLQRIKGMPPSFFERLVVDLLLKMGYGGTRADAGDAIGKAGDEGIDGVIAEDRLGLDLVYLQAKRWEGTVGRPEIQKFVGALHGKRARKGVFLTTGDFSDEALAYVQNIDPRVVLIDGEQLADFMIDFDVGVAVERTYALKRVDSDFFEPGTV
jgi:restriction system protein